MTYNDLFYLVQNAKVGNKEAIGQIIMLFEPSINKVCRNVARNEQLDLKQDLKEKIIRAVLTYDLNSIPSLADFIDINAKK